MPRWNRVDAFPVGIPGAGRTAGHVEQVLRRKSQSGERSVRPPFHAEALTWNKRSHIVFAHYGFTAAAALRIIPVSSILLPNSSTVKPLSTIAQSSNGSTLHPSAEDRCYHLLHPK